MVHYSHGWYSKLITSQAHPPKWYMGINMVRENCIVSVLPIVTTAGTPKALTVCNTSLLLSGLRLHRHNGSLRVVVSIAMRV
ncbi:TPA: hypothetical protein NKV27_003548 [Vibrio parahaemolyticus]|nr:hypothetical protein [Vibrio parahaemolyticus]EJG1426097.1 hypothetical protein [Vibrio parahaemolyticus]HCH3862233.1 hypothetical protein [Vibrio parahaemolyticus]